MVLFEPFGFSLKGGLDWEVPHRLEKKTSASEDGGSRREWIVRSHIGWGGEQNIPYKGVSNLSLIDVF